MKSDCVLNDDELEEKRQVIIKNRIKRMKRNRFNCCSGGARTVYRQLTVYRRGHHHTVNTATQPISFKWACRQIPTTMYTYGIPSEARCGVFLRNWVTYRDHMPLGIFSGWNLWTSPFK